MVEQLDVGAAISKALSAKCIETLWRVGDEVVSSWWVLLCGLYACCIDFSLVFH
jgi:hypothetical protein